MWSPRSEKGPTFAKSATMGHPRREEQHESNSEYSCYFQCLSTRLLHGRSDTDQDACGCSKLFSHQGRVQFNIVDFIERSLLRIIHIVPLASYARKTTRED